MASGTSIPSLQNIFHSPFKQYSALPAFSLSGNRIGKFDLVSSLAPPSGHSVSGLIMYDEKIKHCCELSLYYNEHRQGVLNF